MKNIHLNLIKCEDEQIHLIGNIQSRGYLFVIHPETKKITHISENFAEIVGNVKATFLDNYISAFDPYFTFPNKSIFSDAILPNSLLEKSIISQITFNDKKYYLLQHPIIDNSQIFELEPIVEEKEHTEDVLNFIKSLLQFDNEIDILAHCVSYLKDLLKMDRVMIYKFCSDKSGEVIAEAKNAKLDSFLHLRYPESDIPNQARKLYSITKFRSIDDVYSQTAKIISLNDKTLDLTNCSLRAVSPTHINYLINMKVSSSYSVSIMDNGKLWGLISCQSLQPQKIDYRICQLSALISNMLIGTISQKRRESVKKNALIFSDRLHAFQYIIHSSKSAFKSLFKNFFKIKELADADGVAFYYEGKILTQGLSYSKENIESIVNYFKTHNYSEKFYTNKIINHIDKLENKNISGIYIRKISNFNLYLIWLKKTFTYEIQWAGNPLEKTIELVKNNAITPVYSYQPRKSFLIFREVINNTSKEWSGAELQSIDKLSVYLERVLTRDLKSQSDFQKEIEKLKKEKDFFSYTISHDLKTPLSVISTYTDLLKYYISNENTKERAVMNKITQSIQRMASMIDGIKEMSNIENSPLISTAIDMDNLIDTIANDLSISKYASNVQFVKINNCNISGSYHLLYHCFYNILSNAFKYSSLQDKPEVYFSYQQDTTDTTYMIRDNGIGIPDTNHSTIFDIFKRADNAADFEGSGIGLSIVKNIIQKHSGKIRFVCGENSGTCFYLSFPNALICTTL